MGTLKFTIAPQRNTYNLLGVQVTRGYYDYKISFAL